MRIYQIAHGWNIAYRVHTSNKQVIQELLDAGFVRSKAFGFYYSVVNDRSKKMIQDLTYGDERRIESEKSIPQRSV